MSIYFNTLLGLTRSFTRDMSLRLLETCNFSSNLDNRPTRKFGEYVDARGLEMIQLFNYRYNKREDLYAFVCRDKTGKQERERSRWHVRRPHTSSIPGESLETPNRFCHVYICSKASSVCCIISIMSATKIWQIWSCRQTEIHWTCLG